MSLLVRSVGRFLGIAAILASSAVVCVAQETSAKGGSPPKEGGESVSRKVTTEKSDPEGGQAGSKSAKPATKGGKDDPLERFPKLPRGPGAPPPSSDPKSLRMTAAQLIQMGGGSEEKGLDELGDRGLELVAITFSDLNSTQYLYFREGGMLLEYRVIADADISRLGDGDFNAGLKVLDEGYFKLVAVTHSRDGTPGWHYFMRRSHEEGDSIPPKEGAARKPKAKVVEDVPVDKP